MRQIPATGSPHHSLEDAMEVDEGTELVKEDEEGHLNAQTMENLTDGRQKKRRSLVSKASTILFYVVTRYVC